jgi:hypothetical protein
MSLRKWGLLSCAMMLALPGFSMAAQQLVLGLVNTSVGVKATSTKNKFRLETDPTLTGSSVAVDNPADLIPTEGLLNNSFDTSQFTLVTDPNTGTYGLGASVQGVAPYEVLGFDVQTVDGGVIDVTDNGIGGSTVAPDTTLGDEGVTKGPDGAAPAVGGGETGNVFDIHFKIVSDENTPPTQALPSNEDQVFYNLFLNQSGDNPLGSIDTTFSDPTSYVTFAPMTGVVGETPETVTFPNIISSSTVPEVSSAGFLGFVGLTLILRRRKAAKELQSLKLVPSQTQTNPIPHVGE